MNPGAEAQGKALTQIIGQFNMKHTTVIIENSQYADTFLNGVRQTVQVRKQDIFNVLALDSNIGTNFLRQKLTDLSTKGWKVIVLHCSPELMLRVVTVAMSTRLYNSGYAWFLSEMAFSRDPDIIAQLPEGLLAIDSFWLGGVEDVVATALDYVMSASMCVLKEDLTISYQQVPYSGGKHSATHHDGDMESDPTPVTHLMNATDFPFYFRRCLRNLINFCDNTTNASSNDTRADDEAAVDNCIPRDNFDVFLDKSARNKGPAFYLLNTVDDGIGDRIWAKVGYITASGQRDLKTVLWPGHNIYGPSSDLVKTYRVVTRAAEPFVVINSQASRKEECHAQVPCLQITNSSQSLLTTVVDDFQSDMKYLDDLYTVHCCKGLALEMLESLAGDLNFRYVVYFVNDTNYGTLVNNNWTGMVGDVISGAADIVAGAFSVTSDRMKVMDFTEPFLQNKLSIVSAEGGSNVSIWAFLSPFSGQVWLCIFLSSIVAGVATSFLEWHSPFGLNPKGRKRTKNYGLGSGLLMVMVLLTGHTINVKAPKSWPGKVIQNVWAGLAIFIMTSYTANLAAHLAGQSAVTSVKSVYDSDLLSKRVAVIPSSAVESFLEKTNPKLSKRAKMSYVDSTITAINMLREHTIDIYLDDTPLLEYGLAKYDKDCKVRLAGPGKEFGSEGYAFGLPRHSWLQMPMSNKILWYTESGYIQDLARKYLSRPQCEHILTGSAHPYGLEHTGGLFIIMLSAVFISILFLILEHLAYSYLVPWLRKQPSDTFWKTESLAFISQRVFRVVRSEKLYSQKQAAQEMITIVKQRDFTRLIQKHELQKRRQATQKRVKTKAEVFQDITANIISYHRQLQSVTDTAENSFDDTECEDINTRVTDNLKPSSNNIAYSAVNSDVPIDCYLRKGDMQMRNHKNGADEDVYVLNSGGFVFPGNNTVDRAYRERATKSWVVPDKLGDIPLPRKSSESYLFFPGTGSSDIGTPYRRSWSGTNYHRQNFQPTKVNDIDNNIMQRSSASTFYYENDVNDNKHNPECCIVSMTTPSPPHEFPPSAHGNLYYYSSTSSSIQSPTDEQREFSPFSSTTSANTDEFSGDGQSSEEVSTISPDCSNSWASLASQFQDSDSHNIDSLENGSQTSADPLILNQTSPSTELSINPVAVHVSKHNRMSYPSTMYDLPRRPPHKLKVSPKKKLSRSRSAGSFPRRISKRDNTRKTPGSTMPKSAVKTDRSDVGNTGDNSSDGEMLSSEVCTKNYVVPLENSAQFSMTSLKKSSDSSPVKNIHQQNQPQNNARRTRSYDSSRRNYFTPNLRIKDNRVKSTLRRHAMSGQQNQLSADFIDEYTLDALSKEDVLILWKKSEIELESRLQEVLARNRRLGLAIDYLTRQDRSGETEEV